MSKVRIIIYISILVILLIGLLFTIFTLAKKNKQTKSTSEITATPLIDIAWPEAVQLIQNCQIKTIFQKRKLEVTLTHKDNRVYKTTEPKFNDVFIEANNLRSNCTDIIQTITE